MKDAKYPEPWKEAEEAYLQVLRLVLDFDGLKDAANI
jgi:hypothetical protein